MGHDQSASRQKIIGLTFFALFAFFAFSIGDEAVGASFEPIGVFLKLELLLAVIGSAFGLWLLLLKKYVGKAVLVAYVWISIIVLSPLLLPLGQLLIRA
jgi:hypothetical protein